MRGSGENIRGWEDHRIESRSCPVKRALGKEYQTHSVDVGLLSCNFALTYRKIPMFLMNILLPSSGIKHIPSP
jgi:hypothetical protein